MSKKPPLRGNYVVHEVFGHRSTYADLTVTFGELNSLTKRYLFDAVSGEGEQRAEIERHYKDLAKKIKGGKYRPVQHAAGLHAEHFSGLTLNEADQTFELVVDDDNPLPLLDGGHRGLAYELILSELEASYAKAKSEQEKGAISAQIESFLELPVGLRIYLDGDPQETFVCLQEGRKVDKTHLTSLKVKQEMEADQASELAYKTALLLNQVGPFKGLIKFDSKQCLAPIPLATLFSKKGSELATSLRGLARIGISFGKDEEFLANAVVEAVDALAEKVPTVLAAGKLLTPPPNGTRGSATMLVGVGACLAYHLCAKGHDVPTPPDLSALAKSAKTTLNESATGNLSGPAKRTLIGEFARHFFEDLEGEDGFHDGLPIRLLTAVSASAYDAKELPKPKKQKGRPPAVISVTEESPDGEPWATEKKSEPWAA